MAVALTVIGTIAVLVFVMWGFAMVGEELKKGGR